MEGSGGRGGEREREIKLQKMFLTVAVTLNTIKKKKKNYFKSEIIGKFSVGKYQKKWILTADYLITESN